MESEENKFGKKAGILTGDICFANVSCKINIVVAIPNFEIVQWNLLQPLCRMDHVNLKVHHQLYAETYVYRSYSVLKVNGSHFRSRTQHMLLHCTFST